MTSPLRQVGIPGLEPPPEERYYQLLAKAREIALLKSAKESAAAEYNVAVKQFDTMLRAAESWPALTT